MDGISVAKQDTRIALVQRIGRMLVGLLRQLSNSIPILSHSKAFIASPEPFVALLLAIKSGPLEIDIGSLRDRSSK
jgi:hypothetical protein